ncbi:MAG: polyprenyl synthetase family protein [Ignavibacteria bacterium]
MTEHSEAYKKYKDIVDSILSKTITQKQPETLYKPLRYILNSGGKRIRPMLVISACEGAGGKMEDAVNAAVAIELLHNFTLVHDDIMDNADTRRGMKTIHRKWNDNVAILCGDLLIGFAYSYLMKTKSGKLDKIVKIFTDGVIEVCEGQGYDKEFENRNDVTLDEYMMMIHKKTAKLLETSAVIGALCGGANDEKVNNIRQYASNIGIAFQIQDDLLDIIADEKELGKKIGGDLVEGKKTYLLLKAMQVVKNKKDRKKIEKIASGKGLKADNTEKIMEIKNIYERYGVLESAQNEIELYTNLADEYLYAFTDPEHQKQMRWFSEMLMGRSF